MNENARNKGRMAIYAMAGLYLVFMAYKLFQDVPYSHGNEKILMLVFMVFFAVVGAAMILMGTIKGYQLSKPSDNLPSDEEIKETEETEECADGETAQIRELEEKEEE